MDNCEFVVGSNPSLHCLLASGIEVNCQQSLFLFGRPVVRPVFHHLMSAHIFFFISTSLSFELPDLRVDTQLEQDNHQELHNSLLNSSVKTFKFNINLSTVGLGISC